MQKPDIKIHIILNNSHTVIGVVDKVSNRYRRIRWRQLLKYKDKKQQTITRFNLKHSGHDNFKMIANASKHTILNLGNTVIKINSIYRDTHAHTSGIVNISVSDRDELKNSYIEFNGEKYILTDMFNLLPIVGEDHYFAKNGPKIKVVELSKLLAIELKKQDNSMNIRMYNYDDNGNYADYFPYTWGVISSTAIN